MSSRNHIAIAAILSIGCGVGVTEPMPDIPQTVEYETVHIAYGDDDLVEETDDGLRQQMLVGDVSTVGTMAQAVVAESNRLIFDHIQQVEEIVRGRPNRTEADVWMWDRTSTAINGRPGSLFVIQKQEDGTIGYTWQLNNVEGEMFEVFSGQFTPRQRIGGRQRGSGVIRFNFDSLRQLDPNNTASGTIVIAFRSIGGVRQVTFATFDLQFNASMPPLTSQHHFVQLPNGAGRLQFVRPVDFLNDGLPFERLAIDAIWTKTQSGRALAHVIGGSLAPNEVVLHECWDEANRVVFGDLTPDIPEANFEDGDPNDCEVSLSAFELFAPDDTPPQGEPRVPGPHPEERDE
jgi:hypothetical protein